MVLHINELTLRQGKSGFKRGLGGRREAVKGTLSLERSSVKEAPTDGQTGAAGRSGARGAERSRELLSGHTEDRRVQSAVSPGHYTEGQAPFPCPGSRTTNASVPLWPA